MSAHDVVAEILPLIETNPLARDESLARPVMYAPETLYGWPVLDVYVPEGDGSLDRVDMTLRLGWVVDAGSEVAAMARERETTDILRAYVADIGTWVRAHRTGASYEALQVTQVDWDVLTTHTGRGALLDLSAYRLIS